MDRRIIIIEHETSLQGAVSDIITLAAIVAAVAFAHWMDTTLIEVFLIVMGLVYLVAETANRHNKFSPDDAIKEIEKIKASR